MTPPPPRKKDKPHSNLDPLAIPGTVVVSAGHGIYYHYGFRDWRAQRDPSNGITEDFFTPRLANTLETLLRIRSQTTTYLAREAFDSSAIHNPSTALWWKVAARYYLKKLLPTHPEIWNSASDRTNNLRERNDDIRSRPLYANHLQADALLSIHTNASNGTASGTRIIYNAIVSTATRNRKLADSMSCYMRELITAVDTYQSFNVANPTTDNDLAELKLATMPTVIVEVAFHDNARDAAALKDPRFRLAAMKGVEKGLRLFNQREPCTPFDLTSVESVTGAHNTPIPFRINYKGFPQFPVEAQVDIVSCPPGATCYGGTVSYDEKTPSPLVIFFQCAISDPSRPTATVGLRTTLIDVDGVKTSAKPSSVTCTPSATAPSEIANRSPSAYMTLH